MIRRVGDAPDPARRYRARPGVYAILPHEGAILTTFQADPDPEYQLPGGGIDPGESPLAALHREVYEETGWRISRPRHLGAFRRFTYMPDYGFHAEKICHIYLARPVRPLSEPPEPGHSALWLPISLALTRLDNAGDRLWLARALRSGHLDQGA